MTTRVVIFGGAGYLGSHVSRSALSKGWQVTSISRQGRPKDHQSWHDDVEWVKGNVFEPGTYRDSLAHADHVITTVGILDHRGFMANTSLQKRIDRLGSTLFDTAQELLSQAPASLSTYDKFNFEAAKVLADESTRHKLESLTYVSAADSFPGLPRRYITTKRAAESYIENLPNRTYRAIFMRPGFMFSSDRGFTKPLARLLGLTYAAQSTFSGSLPLGAAGIKPLDVSRVGASIIEACRDPKMSGRIEVHRIEALADLKWRSDML